MSRLGVVGVREVPDANAEKEAAIQQRASEAEQMAARAQGQQAVATEMLLTALTALSKRTLVALANLFVLLTVASAFYLWLVALPDLDTMKIIGCSIYSLFILLMNVYGRHK